MKRKLSMHNKYSKSGNNKMWSPTVLGLKDLLGFSAVPPAHLTLSGMTASNAPL